MHDKVYCLPYGRWALVCRGSYYLVSFCYVRGGGDGFLFVIKFPLIEY